MSMHPIPQSAGTILDQIINVTTMLPIEHQNTILLLAKAMVFTRNQYLKQQFTSDPNKAIHHSA